MYKLLGGRKIDRSTQMSVICAFFVILTLTPFSFSDAVAQCMVDTPGDSTDVSSLPLVSIDDLNYAGAFTFPDGTYGESSMNFSFPIIEKSGSSLFVVGHVYDDAIAEFRVPSLVNSTNVSDLNSTGAPIQNFASVLDRASGGNSQSIDQINGMEHYNGQLIIHGVEYYDGAADNTSTTIVVSDSSRLASSTVKGFFRLPGAARAAGWMSELPPEWKTELGKSHIVGNSNGKQSIDSRNSMGPSAYAVNASDIVSATSANTSIPDTKLLEFSLENPLNDDLYNDSRSNDLWTVTASAAFGFVVPGSRTYATFGTITGISSGLGYKITQDDGNVCGGPCSYQASDQYNYYWFWDMNDLLDVKAGTKASYDVRPYAYGEFRVPFQSGYIKDIAGGTYDINEKTLYLSIREANNSLGLYSNPPVIAAYKIAGF